METYRLVRKRIKGGMPINASFYTMLFVFFLIAFITFTPIVIAKVQLDNFCDEVIRMAEIEGEINQNVYTRINELKTTSIHAENISFEGTNYMPGSSTKVQLNEKIVVSAEYTYHLNWGFAEIDIPLKSIADGYSENYWK